jgi:hypothetical protein
MPKKRYTLSVALKAGLCRRDDVHGQLRPMLVDVIPGLAEHQPGPVPGRAVVGLRRDALAFPGERGRFTRLNDEGSGRLRELGASICRRRPGFSRLQLAPTVSRLT